LINEAYRSKAIEQLREIEAMRDYLVDRENIDPNDSVNNIK
jgi:hypothetical protein